eukprot:2312806-Rhodomonas_salina.2
MQPTQVGNKRTGDYSSSEMIFGDLDTQMITKKLKRSDDFSEAETELREARHVPSFWCGHQELASTDTLFSPPMTHTNIPTTCMGNSVSMPSARRLAKSMQFANTTRSATEGGLERAGPVGKSEKECMNPQTRRRCQPSAKLQSSMDGTGQIEFGEPAPAVSDGRKCYNRKLGEAMGMLML